MTEESRRSLVIWLLLVLAAIGIVFLIAALGSGCAYAHIHKKDIGEFHAHFKAYRGFVEVKPAYKDDEASVEEGADNMEKTLEAWMGKEK